MAYLRSSRPGKMLLTSVVGFRELLLGDKQSFKDRGM
jgi:hypothetical protein